MRRRVNGRQREEKEWEGGNDWDSKKESMKRRRK
jgi:hypothetical protein